MSKRAIYVLTYDSQTEAQMNQWVQTIRTRAPKAPVLLIYDKTNDPKNQSMADLNLHGLYEHFWRDFKFVLRPALWLAGMLEAPPSKDKFWNLF